MKIKRIYIEKYKNLIDFELNFDEHISILIGKNGSGKSNFQEAIIKIFQFLDPNITSKKALFNFEVDFEYDKLSYTYSSRDYIRDYKNSNFPKNIFYYSNTPKKTKNQKGCSIKVSNISIDHYKVVLISLWFSRLSRHKELLGKFNIQSIDGFSFKGLPEEGKFYSYRLGNKHKQSYFNLSSLEEMHEVFRDEKDFFNELMVNVEGGGIQNIDIELSLNNGEKINANDLSDGEKQLLATYGLSIFLDDQEDIFIFDEPDTYLHPNWQKSFIPDIINEHGSIFLSINDSGDILATEDGSRLLFPSEIKAHFIITTHSPLLVGSSERIDIYGLESDGVSTKLKCSSNNQVAPKSPEYILIDVYGNKADFIYKEVFGLESTRAKEIYEQAEELHMLLLKANPTTLEIEKIKTFRNIIKERLGDDPKDSFLAYLDTEDILEILKTNYAKNSEK